MQHGAGHMSAQITSESHGHGGFSLSPSAIHCDASLQSDAPPSAWIVQRAPGAPRLNLGRNVHCLFGLTFDAVTLDEAVHLVRQDAHAQRPCFISTPNVNFVVAAQTDAAFRDSVLRSDLSLADGMPIVWAARLMGVPIRQRVAGSDLFERLHQPGAAPLKIFFFGGPDGVAAQAAQALNAQGGTLQCVGFESPGFGSIEDISSEAQIDRINASGADFIVVALGAKKGQAWIEHNRHRLNAPLISHLGAVVNFVAGTVERAPTAWRSVGLEWLWRIKEEPSLWRRYANDGHALVKLLFTQVLPCAWARTVRRHFGAAPVGNTTHEVSVTPGTATIRLSGVWDADALAHLKRDVAPLLQKGATVQFDLAAVSWLDSAMLGFLMLLDEWQREAPILAAGAVLRPEVLRLIHWHGAGALLR
jgi:N-acetylglucosaminyldiphosphoundecaprenol N-acetyl-beta-D-mannosaminyltransferase